jgi:hypothetical protein
MANIFRYVCSFPVKTRSYFSSASVCVGVSSSISFFLMVILTLLFQVTGALQTSTEVMRSMQSLVRLPEIQKTMQELSRSVILTSKFFLFNFVIRYSRTRVTGSGFIVHEIDFCCPLTFKNSFVRTVTYGTVSRYRYLCCRTFYLPRVNITFL